MSYLHPQPVWEQIFKSTTPDIFVWITTTAVDFSVCKYYSLTQAKAWLFEEFAYEGDIKAPTDEVSSPKTIRERPFLLG